MPGSLYSVEGPWSSLKGRLCKGRSQSRRLGEETNLLPPEQLVGSLVTIPIEPSQFPQQTWYSNDLDRNVVALFFTQLKSKIVPLSVRSCEDVDQQRWGNCSVSVAYVLVCAVQCPLFSDT